MKSKPGMVKLVLTIAIMAMAVMSGVAWAVKSGSIVGWGWSVVGVDMSSGFKQVSAGAVHSLGLKEDGSIVAWGDNYCGQCNLPSPNSGFVAVASGWYHTLGLKGDGSIVAWGYNGDGECNVPSSNSGFVAVAGGYKHSLGLRGDGSIVAWGDNHDGQCDVPLPNSGFIAVAAGEGHSLGLKGDGLIVAWGWNNFGQCNIPSPNSGFVGIAAGTAHNLGLKSDGSIVAWGSNSSGECKVPSPNSGFIAIAAGAHYSLGLKGDGSIVAWGSNAYGQCNMPSPNSGFTEIAVCLYHNLGLKGDGSIIAWGQNDRGQCNILSPSGGFVAVAGGEYHSLGLKLDGSIVAWGENYDGQCNMPSPNSGFIEVAGGYKHSLGLKSDGSIVAWGYNNIGQCNIPSPNSEFVAVAGGGYHSMGLKRDGSIVACGDNYYGQCNVPSPNIGFVAVAAGECHSLGLKGDGAIVAWGRYSEGQCNVPSPNSGFVAVAGGEHHSLGLKVDGSIVAWGDNSAGQCNVPSPNSGFVAIAAGGYHSLGLKGDGSIVAWGCNEYGQCNVPLPKSGFVAIAAGFSQSLGIRMFQGAISVIPSGGSYKTGDQIKSQIAMDTAGEKVLNVQVTLNIDPTMLEVADDPDNPGSPLIAIDSKFPLVVDPGTVSVDKKTITIAANNTEGVSGSAVHFADITFNVLKNGLSKVTFMPAQDESGTQAKDDRMVNIIGTYNNATYTAGWNHTGEIGGFDLPVENITTGILSLQSTSSNTFGFWYLDDAIDAPTSNTLYRVRCAVKSDQTDRSKTPTFRIRYNSSNFMQGDFIQVNSNDAGEASPATAEKIYDLYFRPQYDAVGVNGTLSFDLINIGNPTDATNATIYLDYLQLDKKAIADLGIPAVVKSYTFATSQENWSNRTLGSFTPPNYSWDNTEGALIMESINNTNTFGYWQNQQSEIQIEHNVLYQLRVKAAFAAEATKFSAATSMPTMRVRMYDHPNNQMNSSFQTPVWKKFEQPQSFAIMSAPLIYKDYYAYFQNKQGIGPYLGIAIDMINLDANAPADSKIAISEVELSTFTIPTF